MIKSVTYIIHLLIKIYTLLFIITLSFLESENMKIIFRVFLNSSKYFDQYSGFLLIVIKIILKCNKEKLFKKFFSHASRYW